MEIFHIANKKMCSTQLRSRTTVRLSLGMKQASNRFKLNRSFESQPEMSKKPRKASVWYKMPSYFFAFVAEGKKMVHAELVIKTLYQIMQQATE